MATYTLTGLRSALTAYETAFAAALGAHPTSSLWDTAREKLNNYAVTYAGLVTSAQMEGVQASLPSPSDLRKELAEALANEERRTRTAGRRLIRAGVRFPS